MVTNSSERKRSSFRILTLFVAVSVVGCASYVTPGRGVALSTLTDADVQALLNRKPASPFPARIAVARIQSPDYRSYGNEGYGHGRYSVVTTRDIEEDRHFERLRRLPMIVDLAPISRLLLPARLESDRELRRAAAGLQTDLLLAYTLETTFRVRGREIGPLALISLGFLPNQEASVTSTASAVIYDVRTGYVYGLAEATAREKQMASVWTKGSAVERSRLKAETKAFEGLLDELEKTWKGVVEQYASKSASQASTD